MNDHPATLAWKQNVRGIAKLVLLAIADHSGANWSVVFSSQQYLAKKCGISRSSVVRALEELIGLGLVVKENRPNSSNRYRLNLQCPDDTTSYQSDTQDVSEKDNQSVREEHKPILNHSLNQSLTKGERRRDSKPREIQLPKELDTPKFKEAWEAFLQHLKELKKPAPTGPAIEVNFRTFLQWGHDKTVESIWYSIGKGWVSVHAPRESPSKPGTEGASERGESSAQKQSLWSLRQQIQAIDDRCKELRAKYAAEVAGGEISWENEAPRNKYYELRKKRKELNKLITEMS